MTDRCLISILMLQYLLRSSLKQLREELTIGGLQADVIPLHGMSVALGHDEKVLRERVLLAELQSCPAVQRVRRAGQDQGDEDEAAGPQEG